MLKTSQTFWIADENPICWNSFSLPTFCELVDPIECFKTKFVIFYKYYTSKTILLYNCA